MPRDLADALLDARLGRRPARLPAGALPTDRVDALRTQDEVATALLATHGPIVAWKVGAASPTAEPSAAPIHAASLFGAAPGPAASSFRLIGIEAELCYRFAAAPRIENDACTQDAIADSLHSLHVAIEILDTRLAGLPDDPLLATADQNNHGALIVGSGRRDWQAIDPLEARITLTIDDRTVVSHRGGNTAGDPRHLLAWLAPHAAARGHPITAGTLVTTGSTTGTIFVTAPTRIEATFDGLPALQLHLA